VLETDESNVQKAFQAYGSNLLYRKVAADAEADTEAQSYYYLYNAHGDVTELIDAEGNIAVSYDYDAFGNILSQDGIADNCIKYAGYQHDEESGLYYLNARYYDSVTARFISEDTYRGQAFDPLSLNLYTYCANNPIMYIDPTGHWKQGDEKLNQDARVAISRLTDLYYSTTDKAEKDRIVKEANEIRNNEANKATSTQNSPTAKAYAEAMKDGKVTGSEWLKISSTLDDKSTQSAIKDINLTSSTTKTGSIVESISNGLDEKKDTNLVDNTNKNKQDKIDNKKVGFDDYKPTQADADAIVDAAWNEYNLEGNEEEKLVYDKAEKKWVGDNDTKYGEWYNMNEQPWCAMFVSYCANEAGVLNTAIPKYASVASGKQDYLDAGRFHSSASDYIPKAGDTIFFTNSNGQNHTGIVVAYDPVTKIVYTIEGNSDNAVRQNDYNKSNKKIVGYGWNGGNTYGDVPTDSKDGTNRGTK
jgi:RHS repeat-associated protein